MKLTKLCLIAFVLLATFVIFRIYKYKNTNVFDLMFLQNPSDQMKMTDEEHKLFKEYRSSLAEGNVEKINNFIYVSPDELVFNLEISKNTSEKEHRLLEVFIKNKSERQINLLQMTLIPISKPYMKDGIKYVDYSLASMPFEARYVKSLKSGESLKQNFILKNEDSSISNCIIYISFPKALAADDGGYEFLSKTTKMVDINILPSPN